MEQPGHGGQFGRKAATDGQQGGIARHTVEMHGGDAVLLAIGDGVQQAVHVELHTGDAIHGHSSISCITWLMASRAMSQP